MDVSANPAHFNASNEAKMTRAEVREMVQHEVQKSQATLDGLLEALQQLAYDTHYERALAQMESKIEKLRRRADAVTEHVRQLDVSRGPDPQQPQIPHTPATVPAKSRIIRSDSAKDSECVASHDNQGCPAEKVHRKLLHVIEATKNAIRIMQTDTEALKVTHESSEGTSSSQSEVNSLCETHAIKTESDSSEMSVDSHYGVKKKKEEEEEEQEEEQVAQTIAMETEEEPQDQQEERLPGAIVYPPLPAPRGPALLCAEARSYSAPPRLSLQLALILDPPGLSALWNLEEAEPLAPPMESYSLYMAMERDRGSGVFQEWKSLGELKAIPLPMCVMITRFKPGFRACFSVVGRDTFGRYGSYSKIIVASVPDRRVLKPDPL